MSQATRELCPELRHLQARSDLHKQLAARSPAEG